jgi:hypothetical protein
LLNASTYSLKIALGKKKNSVMTIKQSFENYPKPKVVKTKEKKKYNPNNPENKEHNFKVSLDNALSFNLQEINPDVSAVFPFKEQNQSSNNIFCDDKFEHYSSTIITKENDEDDFMNFDYDPVEEGEDILERIM